MKRLLICTLIITAVIGLCLYSYSYCEKTAQNISDTLSLMIISYDNSDYKSAEEYALTAKNQWHDISENTVFVEDTECDNEITMTLARIEEMVKRRSEDLYYECIVAKELLSTFVTRQKPTISNVF